MNFLTFEYNGHIRTGVLNSSGKAVIPFDEIMPGNPPLDMLELIRNFSDDYFRVISAAVAGSGGIGTEKIRIMPPIPEPIRNIICVGKNYRDHIEEVAKTTGDEGAVPKYPIYFSKMTDRMLGPDDRIPSHSGMTGELDYESELAVVIGREGRDIPYQRAQDYIFGYTIFNDISVRDVQRRHVQWFRGKSLDGTSLMGPYIVHKSDIPYPPKLNIGSRVNGQTRQNSNTGNFIFDISTLISDLSRGLTLKCGDIISTGTPSGVGIGFKPPRYLKHGDVVECFVEGIGTLKNTVD